MVNTSGNFIEKMSVGRSSILAELRYTLDTILSTSLKGSAREMIPVYRAAQDIIHALDAVEKGKNWSIFQQYAQPVAKTIGLLVLVYASGHFSRAFFGSTAQTFIDILRDIAPTLSPEFLSTLKVLLQGSSTVGNVFYFSAGGLAFLQYLKIDFELVTTLRHCALVLPEKDQSALWLKSVFRGFAYLLFVALLTMSGSLGQLRQATNISETFTRALSYIFILSSNGTGAFTLAHHLLSACSYLLDKIRRPKIYMQVSPDQESTRLVSASSLASGSHKSYDSSPKPFDSNQSSQSQRSSLPYFNNSQELSHWVRAMASGVATALIGSSETAEGFVSEKILQQIDPLSLDSTSDKMQEQALHAVARLCIVLANASEKGHADSGTLTYTRKHIMQLIFEACVFFIALSGVMLLGYPQKDNPLFTFPNGFIFEWLFFLVGIFVPVFKGVFFAKMRLDATIVGQKGSIDPVWFSMMLTVLNIIFMILCSFSFAGTAAAMMEAVQNFGGSDGLIWTTMIPVALTTVYATALTGFYGAADIVIRDLCAVVFRRLPNSTQASLGVDRILRAQENSQLARAVELQLNLMAQHMRRLSSEEGEKLLAAFNAYT